MKAKKMQNLEKMVPTFSEVEGVKCRGRGKTN